MKLSKTIILISVVFLICTLNIKLYAQNTTYANKEPLITNVFYETDIRQALTDMSAQCGIPIIPDDSVQGIISLELKDVPLEKALRMILVGGGYSFRKVDDSYYLIGLPVSSNPSFGLLTTTEFIKSTYIRARDIPELLSEHYEPYVKINEETNTMTITATPDIIGRIKEDISKFDRPPAQVMIEAIVTEISTEALKNLGIDWTGSWSEGHVGMNSLLGSLRWTSSGDDFPDLLMSLNNLVENGKAVIRANPRIATLDRHEASIHIGREEYHLINTGSAAYPYNTLQAITSGVTLKIIPVISHTGEITVTIQPEVSDVAGKGKEGLPVISKRNALTTLRVQDGQMIVIGGLLQKSRLDKHSKTPILGDIPLMGALFSSKEETSLDTEMVVLIRPRILTKSVQKEQLEQSQQIIEESIKWIENDLRKHYEDKNLSRR